VGTYNALADPRRIYGGEGREKKNKKRGEEKRRGRKGIETERWGREKKMGSRASACSPIFSLYNLRTGGAGVQDVLYTGSVTNTAEYKSCGDMKSYVSSMISMTVVPGYEQPKRDESLVAAVKRVMAGMFDFSLLKTLAFLPILAAGFLCFFGLHNLLRSRIYTQGEVTSQNLWPRYDRHFLSIT